LIIDVPTKVKKNPIFRRPQKKEIEQAIENNIVGWFQCFKNPIE
jgi:hypothetical protein